MRVVLNNLTAVARKTGIGHYVAELVQALRVYQPTERFATFPGPWIEAAVRSWASVRRDLGRLRQRNANPNSGGPRGGPSCRGTLARRWASWHFRTFWSWRSFDLYHEPNYIPFECDRPTVATVHDLSVLLRPEWHPHDRVAHFQKHFEAGLGRCQRLLTDSEFTRGELIRIFGVAPEKVVCIPLGIRADLVPLPDETTRPILRRLALPAEYLLHVGTLEPRKNLKMLLRAYQELPAPVRERCPLVLVGGWGWNVAGLAESLALVRHHGVQHLGYVADRDLPALYNGARALVFPSHYEGFGLPPLEMMACGGAVIASTAGSVVETVGGKAHLLEADDLPGWREAMRRVIMDKDWHAMLRRGAPDVARPYTWERCARETYWVYATACGKLQSAARAA